MNERSLLGTWDEGYTLDHPMLDMHQGHAGQFPPWANLHPGYAFPTVSFAAR